MSRRGGVLLGLVATALVVVAVVWLLAGRTEHEGTASVLAPRRAETAAEGAPPVALAGAQADGVQPLAAAAESPVAEAPAALNGELRCRLVSKRDGTPLAGVEVTVFHDAVPYAPGPRLSTARTDVDGVARFTFPIASNVWQVRAAPGPGHALCELQPNVVVQPGKVETLDLLAARGGVLAGIVVDGQQNPVPNAQVSAWCDFRANVESAGPGWLPEPDLAVEADGAGRFRVEGIGPFFVLAAGAPGLASVRVFNGELREDDVRDDVKLVLGPAAEFRGRVLDPDRKPLARRWVEARSGRPDEGFGVPMAGRPLKVMARTDDDGRFVLAPLAAQSWQLLVKHERFGQWSGERTPDGSEIEILFTGGCQLAGLVRGADGAPLAGAKLVLRGASEDVGYGPIGETAVESGADGRFVLQGLMPTMAAVLSVSAPGHAVHALDHLVVSAEPREPLELRLVAELAIGGQVVDEHGQPLAHAGISILGDRTVEEAHISRKPSWESLVGNTWVHAGDDGRFRLDQLYDGMFVITASDPRDKELSRSLTVRSGVEDLVIRLDPAEMRGAVLGGIARDGLSGAPLAGEFSVSLISADETAPDFRRTLRQTQFHDPGGAWSLQGIPPGSYYLSASATGYAHLSEGPLSLEAGERTLDLVMLPERGLRLRAVDQDGVPVSEASARFESADGGRIMPGGNGQIGVTDEDGRIAAQGLPAAPIVVVMRVSRAPGFYPGKVEHRFPFDLRQEPVGVQQVVLPRDKQRLLVLSLYQQRTPEAAKAAQLELIANGAPSSGSQDAQGKPPVPEPAGAFTGFDPTDAAAQEWVKVRFLDGTIGPPAVSVLATLHAEDGAALESASCEPSGRSFALRSTQYTGDSPMPSLLLALPAAATRLDVTAPGCAPASLAVPAGDGIVRRVVVLRPAD